MSSPWDPILYRKLVCDETLMLSGDMRGFGRGSRSKRKETQLDLIEEGITM